MNGRRYCAFSQRFSRIINVVDSTTIKLIANCLDWAKHRRRKAAAKMQYEVVGQQALQSECAPLRTNAICRVLHRVRRVYGKYE